MINSHSWQKPSEGQNPGKPISVLQWSSEQTWRTSCWLKTKINEYLIQVILRQRSTLSLSAENFPKHVWFTTAANLQNILTRRGAPTMSAGVQQGSPQDVCLSWGPLYLAPPNPAHKGLL